MWTDCGWVEGEAAKMPRSQAMNGLHALFKFVFYLAEDGIFEELLADKLQELESRLDELTLTTT